MTVEATGRPGPELAERAAPDAAAPRAPARETSRSRSAAGFWLYAGHLWTVFGIAISNALLGLALLASPFARAAESPDGAALRPALRRGRWLLGAAGAYAALLVISSLASLDPGRSLRASSELFNLSALVLALVLVRGERRVRTVVDGVALVGGLLALVGLGQFVLGHNDLSHRITGPFSHYMTFSGVLLIADMALIARVASRPDRGWARAWRWTALAAVNAALLATYTRSAWVGLAVAVTLLLLVRKPKLLLAYPLLAALFWLLAPAPVLDRAMSIADVHDPSNQDRISMARAGAAMIADRPWTGLGPEMVSVLYPAYRVDSAVRDHVPHLHDTFLQIAAERGLPALAVYLALMAIPFFAAARRFRREGGFAGPCSDLWVAAMLAIVAFNVAGLFEHNWGDTEVQRQVLFFLALPFCIGGSEAAPRSSSGPAAD